MVKVNTFVTILPFAAAVLAWKGPVPRMEVKCICKGLKKSEAAKATEMVCAIKASGNSWMDAMVQEDGYCAMWHKAGFDPTDAQSAQMFGEASDEDHARFAAHREAAAQQGNFVNDDDITVEDCMAANPKCTKIAEDWIRNEADETRLSSERLLQKQAEEKRWKWFNWD